MAVNNVHSSPTFWQYAKSGLPSKGQDYFIGDAAGLQRYCFSYILCPCIRVKANGRAPLDLLQADHPISARLYVYNVSRCTVEGGGCGMFLLAQYCLSLSSLVVWTICCAVSVRIELELCVYFNAVKAQPHSCAGSSLNHMIVVQAFERLYDFSRWDLSLKSRCTFALPSFIESNVHLQWRT